MKKKSTIKKVKAKKTEKGSAEKRSAGKKQIVKKYAEKKHMGNSGKRGSKQSAFREFIDSFKVDSKFPKIILFDLLFYAITFPLFQLIGWGLTKQAEKIDLMSINNQILTKSAEEIQSISSQVQGFFVMFVFAILLLVVIAVAAWSLSRGLIYANILKKRFTKKHFFSFAGLNLIIGLVGLAMLIVFSTLAKVSESINLLIGFLIVMLVFAYLVSITYVCFFSTKEVFSSIGKALTIGTKRIGRLIMPCIFIVVMFLVIGVVFARLIPVATQGRIYISLVVYTIFLAWARLYIVPLVNKLVE